ncbi:MAG: discoidin domain-containing protein [Oscillospiraceae bacterium]|nr:discoidin domain-containing protein [Oscillospiraceae bacterium]
MTQTKGKIKQLLALIMVFAIVLPMSATAVAAPADETYVFADTMMDDFLAVYLRDHLNRQGQTVGKSTWRWSDHTNTPNASGEKSRETDFWLSALIFDTFNDALEYSKDLKHKVTLDALYESFMNSGYHPTWDVHVWDNNTYNDDLCWWAQAFERTYRLTGDTKYLETSMDMFSEIWSCWENASSPTTRYGGAPYGGITWRHNNVNNWQTSGKNVCTNANAALIAARLAKTLAATDSVKSAAYASQAKQIYDWSYAHLYKGNGYVIDTVNSSGSESTAQFTYNYGMFAGAAYEMYTLFGDEIYLQTCKDILNYGWNSMTLADGLTIKDEGQGDSAGFKMILLRQTANIVYKGGLVDYEKYLKANAVQAWKNRRLTDGLCGSNLAMKPKPDAGIASPCAILGPALLYWTGIDPTLDYGYDLIDLTDGKDGIYQSEAASNEYINYDSSQSGYTGTGYTQYWDADGPHVQDGYVRFDVEVAEAGIYKLNFRWYTRGNNTRRLSINNGPISILNFTRTAANRWEDLPYYAYFNEGINTVKVIYYNKNTHPTSDQDMDSWLFLDYLAVDYLAPCAAPKQTVALNGVNSIADYTDGWNGATDGQYVEFNVTVPKTGVYTLDFFYSNNSGSASSRELTVNGYASKNLISFPVVGPGWSHSSKVSVPDIALEAGENSVRLANNSAKGTTQYINLLKYLGVTLQYSVAAGEEMMQDFIDAYLREHYDEDGNPAGISTWRWTDNPEKGGGSTYEKRRETDFWLSALIFDTFNDALEYSKNPKYIAMIDGLFESFIESKWHPTWDVHDWMFNTYTDDLCWWAQAFERSYRLTGDQKYLDMAEWMWEEIMKSWDETPGYGGEPYGGFFWRRTAGDNVINPLNASKNVCSNLNSCIVVTRLAKDYATIDPAKSAAYLEQAKKGFAWAKAHLLRDTDYYIYDNVSYNGNRSTGQYTYNYGNFAGAAYELYAITGEQEYMDICLGVLRNAWDRFSQNDNLTITGSEGTGDGSGFKMILIRQTASVVNYGGVEEFRKYLDWNAELAWKNRRMSDGLCGVNLATVPTATTDLASPCSAIGPQLAFYTHLDMDSDFGVSKSELLEKINEAKAIGQYAYSPQSFAALQAEIAKAEGIYDNEYASSRSVASEVAKLNTSISRLREINHPEPLLLSGKTPTIFELEDAVFTDSVSKASAIAGFSGTGYATGFKTDLKSGYKEKASFTVDSPVAFEYNLSLRAAVYLKDEAFGKTRTYSATSGYGHQIDVTDGEIGSYWPVTGVSATTPQWLQIDLRNPTEINLVRIRVRNNQASRTADFSLWGGTDKENLVELKASQRYSFTRTSSPYTNAGNYVDVEFDPTVVRYLRVVFTYSSVATCEVAEFEAYAPVRTAALYVDGVKTSDIVMPVNDRKLTGASWETGAIQWQDVEIKGVQIPAGQHDIAIVSEGATLDQYVLDNITIASSVDKTLLDAEIEISPIDREEEFYAPGGIWADYVAAYNAAVAASEYEFSTQLVVDKALEDLQAAHASLGKKITSIGFPDNVPAMVTLARGQSYTFQAIFDSAFEGNFAIATDFEWSLLVPGFAVIDAASGKVIAGTKAGTVPVQIKDKITGLTAQLVLRIV